MPVENQVIPSHHLVITRMFGEVVYDDVLNVSKQLLADPEFNPKYDQLVDLSGVVKVNVSSDMLRNHARSVLPYEKSSSCSVIATSDLVYGMARMYASVQSDHREFRVFRTVMEAEAWLASEVNISAGEYSK